MREMDIEKKKTELFAVLLELEDDLRILRENIAKARAALVKVQTIADAKEFDEYCDLEKGLNHIRLF